MGMVALAGVLVDNERTQCEPDWGRQSSPLEHTARRRPLTASSLGNPLFTRADVNCSQDGPVPI
jgi:hypothetical protein